MTNEVYWGREGDERVAPTNTYVMHTLIIIRPPYTADSIINMKFRVESVKFKYTFSQLSFNARRSGRLTEIDPDADNSQNAKRAYDVVFLRQTGHTWYAARINKITWNQVAVYMGARPPANATESAVLLFTYK